MLIKANLNRYSSKQQGVSLVELMIGITISLILLTGVISVFANMSSSSTTVIQSAHLNNELRSITSLIIRELQKAGYSNAWDNSGAEPRIRTDLLQLYGVVTLNDTDADCNEASHEGTDTCDCILYRYDEDDDGLAGTSGGMPGPGGNPATNITDNEFFGFRFFNNGIDLKTGGGALTDDDCTDGNWQAITSGEVRVTELSFQISSPDSFNDENWDPADDGDTDQEYMIYEVAEGNDDGKCDATETCLDRRKVNIVVAGELARDDDVTLRLETEVKLMNDHYFEN